MIPTGITAALLTALCLAPSAQDAARAGLPAPDPALQAGIRRLLAAPGAKEQREALEALRAGGGKEHELLVPQLFLFSHRATDTREAMLLGVVLAELAIPPAHVVRALVPLLEDADRPLRQALGNVLSEYEDRSLDRGASFTIYGPLLEREPPLGLVRHLFETDPGAALLALARAQVVDAAELRPLLWAEHEVEDLLWRVRFGFIQRTELVRAAPEALEQLELLARHPRWWARLYAAAIANAEPALGAAARVEELRRDDHPLVRALSGAPEEKR